MIKTPILTFVLLLFSSTAMATWNLIGTGTGFVVSGQYALTSAQTLKGCDAASVHFQGQYMDAEIEALDISNDLGLILLEKSFPQTATFRGGKAIRLGDAVVNYGYPLFGELSDYATVKKGEINSLAGAGDDSRFMQHDADTQPGNRGGPLLDRSGHVVGVVSASKPINLAVKSFVAEAFLSASGVDYEKAQSRRKLDTADIVEVAESFTVLVGCWQDVSEQTAQTEAGHDAPQEAATGDGCPEGMIQTYKGCEEITKAQADAAAAEAAAVVRGKAAALAKAMAQAEQALARAAALAEDESTGEVDTESEEASVIEEEQEINQAACDEAEALLANVRGELKAAQIEYEARFNEWQRLSRLEGVPELEIELARKRAWAWKTGVLIPLDDAVRAAEMAVNFECVEVHFN
jgi:hypothetical protein